MGKAIEATGGTTLETLLRIGDVAKVLNMSRRTLERMISAGAFPGPDKRPGAIKLWRPSTVQGWIEGKPVERPRGR